MKRVGFVIEEPHRFVEVDEWPRVVGHAEGYRTGEIIGWVKGDALVLLDNRRVEMINYACLKFIVVPSFDDPIGTAAEDPPPRNMIQAHGDVRIEIPPYQATEAEDLPGFIDAENYGVLDPEDNELGRVKCFRFFLVLNAPKVTGGGDTHLTLKGLDQKRRELWAQQGES